METSDLKITYISAEEYQSDSQVIQPKDGYVYYRMEFEFDATMSPGKKAAGAVYYEVPEDAKEITLEYETNFLSQNKIVFIVK